MSPREQKRLQRLQEVQRRIATLKNLEPPLASDAPILQHLATIEQQLRAGGSARADWADHELQWQARLGALCADIMQRSAHLMLAFEDMERVEPGKFMADDQMQKLLHWWREQGGREHFLGSITLEERRALEQKAEEWRRKNP